MTTHSEQEDNSKTDEGIAPPSNKELTFMLVRMKVKQVADYILDGFAPVAAVAALIVAVMAINSNHAGQARLEQSAASLKSLNTSLIASQSEVLKLKSAITQERSLHEETYKKQAEKMATIIQNVNQLQVKMKISPTLEEQLHQHASASAVKATVSGIAAAPLATATAGSQKKSASQAQVLTQAIEKFNDKKHK